jgi:putative restriction endonuclease
MRYWWVNQNQTHHQELEGGYLWSPKRNANDARNPFYEFMREVTPGDVVFSFVDTKIIAIGIVNSYCYENPKPPEFRGIGMYWNTIGWRVRVTFTRLVHQIRPKDHMAVLQHTLPTKYSPLQTSGNGNQGVYLTQVSEVMAQTLLGLIGSEAINLAQAASAVSPLLMPAIETADLELWENHIERTIQEEPDLSETEREMLIVARRGQGLFKQRVMRIESRCRITKVDNPAHLRASHCKPWRDCTNNQERLDGENGLLLTPSIDHLFDRGFISFEDSGRLIISPVAHTQSLQRMGVATDDTVNVGQFSEGQRRFLDYHRNSVLLMAGHWSACNQTRSTPFQTSCKRREERDMFR